MTKLLNKLLEIYYWLVRGQDGGRRCQFDTSFKGVSRESGLRGVGGQGLCQSWSMTKSVNDQVGQLLFNRVGQ